MVVRKNEKAYIKISEIYGISRFNAIYYCGKIGLNYNSSSTKLTRDRWKQVLKLISAERLVNDELRLDRKNRVQQKINLRSYQGLRSLQGLPLRGQNTKNNCRTSRKLRSKYL